MFKSIKFGQIICNDRRVIFNTDHLSFVNWEGNKISLIFKNGMSIDIKFGENEESQASLKSTYNQLLNSLTKIKG